MSYFEKEVAIGPVTGRTLYGYRSGSHVLFHIYSRAHHFLLFYPSSIVLLCCPFTLLDISCSVLNEKTI